MINGFIKKALIWLFLNIIIVILFDFALFYQLRPEIKNRSFYYKLFFTELFATVEWLFLIPAIHLGNTFLSAIQIVLASFIFNFIGQIGTNLYMLNRPITIDDYVAMLIIFTGILISTFKIFG